MEKPITKNRAWYLFMKYRMPYLIREKANNEDINKHWHEFLGHLLSEDIIFTEINPQINNLMNYFNAIKGFKNDEDILKSIEYLNKSICNN